MKEQRNNCPFLDGGRCAIHDAEPLVCALYPLAQEISREGETAYFLQPTQCGGQRVEARVEDYLALYGTLEREPLDVRWAMACMDLEDRVAGLDLAPVLRRRMQDKLWQALYFGYDPHRPWREQLEANLLWLEGELDKLASYQERLAIKKTDG